MVNGTLELPRAFPSDSTTVLLAKLFTRSTKLGLNISTATCLVFLYFTIQCVKDNKSITETQGEGVGELPRAFPSDSTTVLLAKLFTRSTKLGLNISTELPSYLFALSLIYNSVC